MQKVRYLIFLLFNLSYKDGNYDESQSPYFNSVIVMMAFQYVILLIGLFSLDEFIAFRVFSESVLTPKWKYVLFFLTILTPFNYFLFIRKKYFDRVYKEFKEATINTKKNQRIGYACLIFYWIIIFVIIGNLKSWLSL